MTAAGATLVAISPQQPDFSRQVIAKNKLTYDILSDTGNKVAARFGLKFTVSDEVRKVYHDTFKLDLEKFNGDASWTLPMPARFIVDRDGVIRYAQADPDYTIRPEPADTLRVLRALAEG